MKKSITIILALFIVTNVFSQNNKGIIYEFKKNQATVAFGNSGNMELGYFKRFTKNLSVGLSFSRAVNSNPSSVSGGRIELYMNDEFADTWDGAYIDFYVNGNYINQFTCDYGYTTIENLTPYLSTGDSYYINHTAGQYPDEETFSLVSDGTTLYSGDGNDVGTVYSGVYNSGDSQVVLPLFVDFKYNFLVKKRIQPSVLFSPGIDIKGSGTIIRYGFGLDYHLISDDHVITAMTNNFNHGNDSFSSFTLRYSYKF
jgi:hypothetical protein